MGVPDYCYVPRKDKLITPSIRAIAKAVNLLDLPIDIEEKLKKESILKTVHYSTKIEGNPLDLDQVHDAIENGAGNGRTGKMSAKSGTTTGPWWRQGVTGKRAWAPSSMSPLLSP